MKKLNTLIFAIIIFNIFLITGILIPLNSDAATQTMYTPNWDTNTISKANLDGSGGVSLNLGLLNYPFGIAISGERMYVVNYQNSKVIRANLDGTGAQDIGNPGSFLSNPTGIAISGGKMYIVAIDVSPYKVVQANLDGTGAQDLGNLNGTLNVPRGIAIDPSGYIYVANAGGNNISKADINGGGGVSLDISGLCNTPDGIAISGGKIYVACNGSQNIVRLNLDGTGVQNLGNLGGLSKPTGIAIDAYGGKMYVVSSDNGNGNQKIVQANLDGTGGTNLGNLSGVLHFGQMIAIFTQHNLTVTKTGNGTIISLPAGINCDTDCNELYTEGTVVTLKAIPDAGSYFNGWTGDCVSQALECKVTMDAAKNVTANFTTTPPSVQTWAKTYGGTGGDWANSIQQTSDGGFIVSGATASFGSGSNDAWILKLNADGTVAWQNTYGGTGDDGAGAIQQTSDGGYIVAGSTASFGAGSADVWILKLNADGTVAWQNTYGGTGDDGAGAIQQTSDGGYIVAGSTALFGAGSADAWVLKLNADGTVAWQKTYGGAGNDYANSVQQTLDGGYIVAGYTDSFGAGYGDAWILKLNADGTVAWQNAYGGAGADYAAAVQQTSDGSYIVAGYTNSFGAGSGDAWILKLNADGTVAWQKTYGGASDDYATAVQQTSDGGYIVAGRADSFGAGYGDAWILKLNADGTVAWQKTYGGAGDDYAYSVQQTSDGGYIVVGRTDSFGAGGTDIWILKLDSAGNISGCPSGLIGVTNVLGSSAGATLTGTAVIAAGTAVSPQTSIATVTDTSVSGAVICTGLQEYMLTVAKSGTGVGSVTSSPAGINCDTSNFDCSGLYLSGSVVTLTASTYSGNAFTGWSGGGCTGTGTCVVTVNAPVTVTANFDAVPTYQMSVVPSGTGAGRVTSTPGYIDCSTNCGDCSCGQSYNEGTAVTLSATADPGSVFTGWTVSGNPTACPGTGNCQVTMSADQSVTADFELGPTIRVLPANYNFGDTPVSTPLTREVTISNIGSVGNLNVTSDMTLSDSTNYSLDTGSGSSPCGSTTPTISPSSNCTVVITFTPKSTGIFNTTLSIISNDPVTPTINVPMSGSSGATGISWAKTYGGTGVDRANTIRQTTDGGYIVAGYTESFGAGNGYAWVMKLGSGGAVQWQKTYGGGGVNEVYSVQQTTDGGYIVAGYTNSSGAGSGDVWIMKLDSDGNVGSDYSGTWQKTYGGGNVEVVYSIQQTTDGGYIVAGYTSSFGAGNGDAWIMKLDSDGNVGSDYSGTWQKTYGGGNVDAMYSIRQTTDGGYIVAGYTDSSGAGDSDAWVMKLNTDGSVAWQKTYGGAGSEYAYPIQQTTDGGYIVAGGTYSFGAGNGDAWIMKLDSDGNVGSGYPGTWQKTYGGADYDFANSIQQTTDGGYIVAGGTYSFGAGNGDVWIMKLDSDGNVGSGYPGTWQKTYGGAGNDYANSIQQTTDGGYIVAGYTESFGAGNGDAWVLKLDSYGNISGCAASLIGITNTNISGIDTNATVTDTSVTGIDTSVTPQPSSATVADTGVTGLDICPPLGSVLDNPSLTWTTGGDAPWFGETLFSIDGDAAQSGAISNGQSSTLQTTINPSQDAILSFYWKVSSDPAHAFLTFYIDDIEQSGGHISGEVDWQLKQYPISAGTHTIKWIYSKDPSASIVNYDAGWVDKVQLATLYNLTVNKTGSTGEGTVISLPPGINCDLSNTDCSEMYGDGSVVTLKAVPAAGFYFAGWSGDCVSQALECKVAIDAAKTVTANFTTTPPIVQTWVKVIGDAQDDEANSVQQTSDGGYIVAGTKDGGSEGTGDFWIMKLTAAGDISWQKTYGNADSDWPYSLEQTADGGFIVTGMTGYGESGSGLIWMLKLDKDGNIEWQKESDGYSERGKAIHQTFDGGYIVIGETNSSGAGSQDILVLKLDKDGNILWKKTYGSDGYEGANDIKQTTDGGYIISGYSGTLGSGAFDAWIIKLDSNGNVGTGFPGTWQKTFGGGGSTNDYLSSIQQTSDGGYIAAGNTESFGEGSTDLWVFKLLANGDIDWQKTFGSTGNEGASSVQEVYQGGYVIAGSGFDGSWILRLDQSGNKIWEKTYGNSSNDNAASVRQTSDNGFIVAGWTSYLGNNRFLIAKLDADGDVGGCSFISSAANSTMHNINAVVGNSSGTMGISSDTLQSTFATVTPTSVTEANVCSGTVILWIGGDGNWSDPAKWSSGSVPLATDDALITVDGDYTVTVASDAAIHNLTLGGASGTQKLSISNPFTFTINGASTINNHAGIDLSGTLNAIGDMTMNGVLTWSGGTITGAGALIINNQAVLSGTDMTLDAKTVINNSWVSWVYGNVYFNNGAQFNNQVGAILSIEADYSASSSAGTGGAFNNNGGFITKNTGTGTTTLSNIAFNNDGTVSIESGTIKFDSSMSFSNTGPSRLQGYGTLDFSGYPFGSNNGIISPGTSIGTLSIIGNLIQMPSSAINIEIGGTAQYDQLNINGAVTLGGTLNVSLTGGFTPSIGDTFTILNYISKSGTFSTQNLPSLTGKQWNVNIGATSVVLTVTSSDTTPPTVSSTSPVNSDTNVPITSNISATFSEAMDASTINGSTFTVSGGVTGTINYDAITHTATLTPSANLAYSTIYTATITAGVKDVAGNNMAAAYTWTFTTAAAPPCTYTFNNPASANVPNTGGNNLSFTVTASSQSCVWTASSNNPTWITSVSGGATGNGTVTYNVSVNTGLGRSGSISVGSQSFVVNQAAENTPPTVTGTNPVNNATSVPITSAVSATFSEAMDATTIAGATFTLTGAAGGVTGTVAYNAGTNTATFTPSANLAYNTTYTATITTGVKDVAGNNMASNYTWSFTTAPQYMLNVTKTGTGSGTVTGNTPHTEINCGSTCSASYAAGTNVTLTAAPAAGSGFAGWSGACSGTNSSSTVTMGGPRTCTATFSDIVYPTVSSAAPNSGATGVPVNTSISATFSEAMNASTITGATFTLTGVAGAVAYNSGTNTATFTPSANLAYNTTYTATVTTGVKDISGNNMASNYIWSFTTAAAPQYNLNVTKTGTGTGTVNSSETPSPLINCGSACSATYNSGTVVTLTATAASGSAFTGWSGACSGGAQQCAVTMDGTKTATANFDVGQVATHVVTPSSGGNGDISPATQQNVPDNTPASFALNPSTGYHVSSVTGTCGGTLNGNTFTTNPVKSNCTVTANFAINTYKITPSVNTQGGTHGVITPSGLQTVNYNTPKSFTLTPVTGYYVDTVTGDCGGTLTGNAFKTNPVTADCAVVANFAANTYSVSTSIGSGTGGSISPTGVTVNYRDRPQFTITPDTGFHIGSASGCGGSLSGNTYTTGQITSNCTVAASFAINTYTISTSAGTGGGISPMSAKPNYGDTPQFMINPNDGYHIVSVSGCGGSLNGNTYKTGQITGNCTVTASFAINTYNVSTSSGTGGNISPVSATVGQGNPTQFILTPDVGYHIASVSGCGGTPFQSLNVITSKKKPKRNALLNNTYTTGPITADCTVTAEFAINTYTVTPSAGAHGGISPSSPQTVENNNPISFGINPDAGYHINSVSGCGGALSGDIYKTGLITGDCTVTASFAIDTHLVSTSAGQGGEINPASATVNDGSTTQFTITPDDGYYLISVSGCGGTPLLSSGATARKQKSSLSAYTYKTGPITADCTVIAEYAVSIFTVTPSAVGNGSIDPSTPQTAKYNDKLTFTIKPDSGYHITTVSGCGGSLSGNIFTTGNITGDCIVSVSFAVNTYVVTASADQNGSIVPSGRQYAAYNEMLSFTVTPDNHYHISSVTGCGGTLSGNTYTTGPITQDCNVNAGFAIDAYEFAISISGTGSGTITANGLSCIGNACSEFPYGIKVVFKIQPDPGCRVADIKIDGVSIGAVNTITFKQMTSDHTIEVVFETM